MALGLFFAGAAAADEVVKTFEDPTFDATVSKIMVVGVHEDRSVRGQFENAVSRALRAVGTFGEASLYNVAGTGELTAETLVAAARRSKADAVMVTRVVDVQTENPDATATFVEYFQAYSKYGDPLPETAAYTVRVRTDLYLVEGQRRIWAVESTAFEKTNLYGVIDGIAQALTAQLRTDGLIESR
jgi:hypothetical protein